MSTMLQQTPEKAPITPNAEDGQLQPLPYSSPPYSVAYGQTPIVVQQGGSPQPNQAYPAVQPIIIYQPNAPTSSTPIPLLKRSSAIVDCPVCGKRDLTATRRVIGGGNHMWAAVTCLFTGLGFIPYMMNRLKNVEHRCGSCGTHLATWYKTSGTEPMVRSLPRLN